MAPSMNPFRLPWFITKYHKNKPIVRALTTGEIDLANSIFGNLIDYETVKIINCPYVPWQPENIFIAPNGFIFVGDRHYRDDYSAHGRAYQQIFIHEMTHVMQYQHGINVLWHGAILQALYYLTFKKYNPYHHVFDEHKDFWDYNIEQQGKIAEHIYLGWCKNVICQNNKQ